MAFYAKVLADSISPAGLRFTTIEACYPRKIHAEMLTHRLLSRNSASSRAIPVTKLIERVESDPVIPIWWGKNEPGMQAFAEVDDKAGAEAWWRAGKDMMVAHARQGVEMGLHKQIVNRIIEPWMWITVLISATEWDNLFGLRIHEAAEPHFQKITKLIKEARDASSPRSLKKGQWHLPLSFVEDDAQVHDLAVGIYPDLDDEPKGEDEVRKRVSVGRCARVSYLTHDGRRDLCDDVKLHDRLLVAEPLHASPAEHVGQALDWPEWFKREWPHLISMGFKDLQRQVIDYRKNADENETPPMRILHTEMAIASLRSGNIAGFTQYRKTLPREHIGGAMP